MDDPNALEAAAHQARLGAKKFSDTASILRQRDWKLSQAAYGLTLSTGSPDFWAGQGAAAFMGAWSQHQQETEKCSTHFDRAAACLLSVARSIEDQLPALRSAKAAITEADDRGLKEGLVNAMTQGQNAIVTLAALIDMMSEQLEEATTPELGRCSDAEKGFTPTNIYYNSEAGDRPPEGGKTPEDGTGFPFPDATLYPNKQPKNLAEEKAAAQELGVEPIQAGTPEFDEMLQKDAGQVKWVITKDGKLWFVPKEVKGDQISHAVASNGSDVIAAGEASIVDSWEPGSKYMALNVENKSGHYQPGADVLEIARIVFEQDGIFVPESSIKIYPQR